jgi:hypothetical protein
MVSSSASKSMNKGQINWAKHGYMPPARKHNLSLVGLTGILRAQAKVYVATNDFSSTINAGARSVLTNITKIQYNKINIVGIALISETNTDWRLKLYKQDTGMVAAYNSDTYIGDIEITSPSATTGSYYEGSAEASIFYWDADNSNEIHIIAENIGANNSKLFVNILYTEAD